MKLEELCDAIEQGYASGKCMYDPGMTTLAEELTSSTKEIKALISLVQDAKEMLEPMVEFADEIDWDLAQAWLERTKPYLKT